MARSKTCAASSGIVQKSLQALGAAYLDDVERARWPDLVVADDARPNKFCRDLRNGTFWEIAVQADVALSADSRAHATSASTLPTSTSPAESE